MKKLLSYAFYIVLSFFFTNCEDVVDIPLETADAKLVVDASLQWQKGTLGNLQTIKLTTTASFYATEVPKVSGAIVTVSDSNTTYTFIENPGTGNYICTNFNPVIGEIYTLQIVYNGEIFTATETLMPVPTIASVEQKNDGGFTGEDIEVKFFFEDDALVDNFYLYKINTSFKILPEFDVQNDEFFQGNTMFALYVDEDMKAGDTLDFTLFGISEQYYNYMNILLGVAGTNGGSPFSTPPATVRGNIINQTNPEKFAFGYFNVSEIDTRSYTVVE